MTKMQLVFKTTGFLILWIGLTAALVWGQNERREDVVYMKNGSVIRGEILEQVPGKYIRIEVSEDQVLKLEESEIERIKRETAQIQKNRTDRSSPDTDNGSDDGSDSSSDSRADPSAVSQLDLPFKERQHYRDMTLLSGQLSFNYGTLLGGSAEGQFSPNLGVLMNYMFSRKVGVRFGLNMSWIRFEDQYTIYPQYTPGQPAQSERTVAVPGSVFIMDFPLGLHMITSRPARLGIYVDVGLDFGLVLGGGVTDEPQEYDDLKVNPVNFGLHLGWGGRIPINENFALTVGPRIAVSMVDVTDNKDYNVPFQYGLSIGVHYTVPK